MTARYPGAVRWVPLALAVAASLGSVASIGCSEPSLDPRAAEIASVMAAADAPLLHARPALVAGKYELMASDPYSYYRGSLAVYRSDWQRAAHGISTSPFALEASSGGVALPLGIGDPHPENFGILRAADGSFGLEANDFDSADRVPYLWDLRRLLAGLGLFARLGNPSDASAAALLAQGSKAIVRAAALSYATSMLAFAKGAPRERITSAGGAVVLQDLFDRSAEDTTSRAELDLTTVGAHGRRFVRGVPDPTTPYQILQDLSPDGLAALPAALSAYRSTLLHPPPAEYFTLLDAVREMGSGVASWPKVRVLLLVRGSTDDPGDDVMLELKELGDSAVATDYPPSVYFDTDQDRVLEATRSAWGRPDADPLWGTSSLLGLPVQIKTETEGEKGLKLKRIDKDRGTPEAVTALATSLGALLARIHAAPTRDGVDPAPVIAAAIGARSNDFADEEAEVSDAYAAQVLADHESFAAALAALGPRLGLPIDDDDAPRPDLAELFGTPPEAHP